MEDVFIVEARRLPQGLFGGSYVDLESWQLGAGLISRFGELPSVDLEIVDGVFFGHCRQAGNGPNPVRTASLLGGVGQDVYSTTVNTACLSGMDAMRAGVDFLSSGRGQAVLCGGMEVMSSMPHLLKGMRFSGKKHGDLILRDGWSDATDPLVGAKAGLCAEKRAEELGLTREEMDDLAIESHRRARRAWSDTVGLSSDVELRADSRIRSQDRGRRGARPVRRKAGEYIDVFNGRATQQAGMDRRPNPEVIFESALSKKNQRKNRKSATGEGPLGREVFTGSIPIMKISEDGNISSNKLALPLRDETIREESELQDIGWLRPVFSPQGRLTPGNTCCHADGAVAFMLATRSCVETHGLKPRARLGRFVFRGGKPSDMTIAPGVLLSSLERVYDTYQVHESFSSQILDNIAKSGISYDRMNLHGGGLALGHPTGISGARVVLSLLSVMEEFEMKTGFAVITSVGGMCMGLEVFR